MSAAIWWGVSGIIAALLGGYAAGRVSGRPNRSTSGWHGLVSWALTTLLVMFLLTSAVTSALTGAIKTMSEAAGGLGQVAATAAQTAAPQASRATDPFAGIEQQLRGTSAGGDAAAARDAAIASVQAFLTGDPAQANVARERAVQALSQAFNIPPDQAQQRLAELEAQYRQAAEQAKRTATQVADTAAETTSRGAIFGFIALVLGAIAGWFGGRAGAVEPTITDNKHAVAA
jgi:hypothetical protein